MTEIVLVLAFLYICLMTLFASFTWRARYPSGPGYTPRVSIVIAARNEEANIVACLDAIVRLSYPRELMQVLVVDDASTDRTAELVEGYTGVHAWISLVRTTHGGTLKGKANALALGCDLATGEFILMTDADCVVPEGWVESTVAYFVDNTVGIVAGFTGLRSVSMFECAQAIDWLSLVSVAAATARMGVPVTAVGNNLSLRRTAYDSVGGYRGLPPSLTEDFMLVRSVVAHTRFRCILPLDRHCLVESRPCSSWTELYRQKKRWFIGGLDMGWNEVMVFMGAFLLNGLIIAALVIEPGWLVLGALLGKCAADTLMVIPALREFSRWGLLRGWIVYETYYFFYILLYPLVLTFSRSVAWKQRTLAK